VLLETSGGDPDQLCLIRGEPSVGSPPEPSCDQSNAEKHQDRWPGVDSIDGDPIQYLVPSGIGTISKLQERSEENEARQPEKQALMKA
jgi:hypothetical protein